MSKPVSHPHVVTRICRHALRVLDGVTDALTMTALVAMVASISWQVFCRYVLEFTPSWSSETALLLLAWLALLGIAKGVRDHSHIVLGVIVDRLPAVARAVVLRLAPALMLLFGVYLVVQGAEFTRLMASSTLPATGLPTSVRYAAMPVSGVLITLYSALQLLGLLPPEAGESSTERTADVAGSNRDGEESP